MRSLIKISFFLFLGSRLYSQSSCNTPDDDPCSKPGGCDLPTSIDSFNIPRVHAVDPNDIIGPIGYDSLQWMSGKANFGYTIRFENDPDFATGPAQVVKINAPLDPKLNLSLVRLGSFGFGKYNFSPPPNSSFYANRLDLRDSLDLYVDVTAGIDINKKEVFWIFESIDPVTGLPPLAGNVGFLPVNDTTVTIYTDTTTQKGEGYVTFTVKPKGNVVTGDNIAQQAKIVFDTNEEIPTNVWKNRIDNGSPTTTMDTLPAIIDSTAILLSWSGTDDSGGVGVALYDLYVSVDSAEYYLYEANIDTTSFVFAGNEGSLYSFYIRAKDYVGNQEPQKFIQDAFTKIAGDLVVATKVFLQGPYNSSTGTMNDILRQENKIPLQNPYPLSQYQYSTAIDISSGILSDNGNNSVVDWVYVELMLSGDQSPKAGKVGLLQKDGDIVGLDGVNPLVFADLETGSYQIKVFHRNHLPIITKENAVSLSREANVVNLANNISIIKGGRNAVKEIVGVYTLFSGDVDDNGQIQNADMMLINPKIGLSGYHKEDLDMNGQVQQNDVQQKLIPNLGRGKQF